MSSQHLGSRDRMTVGKEQAVQAKCSRLRSVFKHLWEGLNTLPREQIRHVDWDRTSQCLVPI